MGAIVVLFFVMLAVSAVLVNKVQQMYMKLMGANMMFFNGGKKLVAIVFIALVLEGCVLKLFGIEI